MKRLSISILLISVLSYADNNFYNYTDYAKSAANNAGNVAQNNNKQVKSISGYTSKVAESKYQNASDDEIKNAANQQYTQNTTAQAVANSVENANSYKVDKNSKAMQDSTIYQKDNYNITHGISDKYVNCKSSKGGMICGQKFFCLDGDCYDAAKEKQPKDAFSGTIAELAALNSAGEDTNKFPTKKDISIFTGKELECKILPFGFNNCCAENGWAHKIQGCPDHEHQVAVGKHKGTVVYVGTKCTAHLPWPFHHVCTAHAEVYCDFKTKLEKIVQNQGRWKQLHIQFGPTDHANCRGITPEELQKIDMSKIDFSAAYSDVNSQSKVPPQEQIEERIRRDMEQKTA